ncbi:MAG: NAD(+)/NADH kinase [Treponema sp.]|nr:NAD(+)/NADH kinase [Treponema sp.]
MKKCLIVENIHKPDATVLGNEIAVFLREQSIAADCKQIDQYSAEDIFEGYDFAITLGGDGTVLYAARGCAPRQIPVFPVNLGEFGFIASVQRNNWQKSLLHFLSGEIETVERNMLHVVVSHAGNDIFTSTCLNEVLITAPGGAQPLSLEVVYNHAFMGHYKADGLIVATATGSTAYSVSAGGPIVDPELDAFLLTPLNSFSLSSRPLVFNPEGELQINILPFRFNSAKVVADGQKSVEITTGDKVVITRAPHKVMLVGCSVENFYAALRSKFNWAGGAHA